jgi:hypothetical protein
VKLSPSTDDEHDACVMYEGWRDWYPEVVRKVEDEPEPPADAMLSFLRILCEIVVEENMKGAGRSDGGLAGRREETRDAVVGFCLCEGRLWDGVHEDIN